MVATDASLRRLQRNRISAQKCRVKRKERLRQLQESHTRCISLQSELNAERLAFVERIRERDCQIENMQRKIETVTKQMEDVFFAYIFGDLTCESSVLAERVPH